MAADIAAQLHHNSSPSQYSLYSSQAGAPSHPPSSQVSPLSSANATPSNSSPTSPRHLGSLVAPRQLRPPKSPLYIPAVLRPTEPPRRAPRTPITPPQSGHNSFDEWEGPGRLMRSDTGDSGKFGLDAISETEGDWDAEGGAKVTALPTRTHWKPDSASNVCDEPACTRYFNYFHRRHHCRRCGNIFCDVHSNYAIPLDQEAKYNPRGTRSRACGHCFQDYRRWRLARSSRSNSESGSSSHTTEDGLRTPGTGGINCPPSAIAPNINGVFGAKPESLAASVPRDWSWSTF